MIKTLKIDLLSEWRSGTGRGRGLYLDAEARKDQLGLPMIPGKQLKGLVRHALETGAAWGHWDSNLVERLCGASSEAAEDSRFDTDQGCLSISSARMSHEWQRYFSDLRERDLELSLKSSARLFVTRRQTAMNSHGLVQEKTLRTVEVCVPMTLYARIQGDLTSDELKVLERALSLIRAVGAHTTRGLGRAKLSLTDEGQA
jgi:CRISPR/Cas system CSM-associated protein Csm3 (group 7 of RAMP superfamily)